VEPSYLHDVILPKALCQQPPDLRRGSAAARFLGLSVRIQGWTPVSCECCVSSLRRADNSSRGVLPSIVCPKSVISKPHNRRPRPGIESKRHKNKNKKLPKEQNCAQRGYNKFQATIGQDNAREVTVTRQQWGWLCWGSSHLIPSIIFQKSMVTNSGYQIRHFVTMEAESISKNGPSALQWHTTLPKKTASL
jgi:hypothetical protein